MASQTSGASGTPILPDYLPELAWHGANHSPDNIYVHFPGHDTLMLVDIVLPGWVPFYGINLSEDVPGYMGAVSS